MDTDVKKNLHIMGQTIPADLVVQVGTPLYERMKSLSKGVERMALQEFQYALEPFLPSLEVWDALPLSSWGEIEARIGDPLFYSGIEVGSKAAGQGALDPVIRGLTLELFKGMVADLYPPAWIDRYFYFDVRSFVFFPRTVYFIPQVVAHLGGAPYAKFYRHQSAFDAYEGVGFRDFREANHEVDGKLLGMLDLLIQRKSPPVFIGLAGPTAAGKTEFTDLLTRLISREGLSISTLEMDHFFLDRPYREDRGIGSMGRESFHFDLLLKTLIRLKNGLSCRIPQYDFITALSSHDEHHHLKEGSSMGLITPGDIVYVEGNFPYLYEEIAALVDIKVFYVTDDPVRLKRKWKRDVDYRKKYDPVYLCNRYFRTQFLKARECYHQQLATCDIAVDTTNAQIWVTDAVKAALGEEDPPESR
jgi:uridine kinase